MKMVKTVCAGCQKDIEKSTSEFNRNARRGRLNYCSIACCSKRNSQYLIKGSSKDEYSPFRMFVNIMKTRQRENPNKIIEIDLKYLKGLWESQNGICPYTGWKLILADSTNTKDQPARLPNRASLDRIDSSKGYVPGNVQFVSMMYQFCKNSWTDADVLQFAKSVATNIQ